MAVQRRTHKSTLRLRRYTNPERRRELLASSFGCGLETAELSLHGRGKLPRSRTH